VITWSCSQIAIRASTRERRRLDQPYVRFERCVSSPALEHDPRARRDPHGIGGQHFDDDLERRRIAQLDDGGAGRHEASAGGHEAQDAAVDRRGDLERLSGSLPILATSERGASHLGLVHRPLHAEARRRELFLAELRLERDVLGRIDAGGGLGASAWIEQRRGRGDDPRKHGAASHLGAGAELVATAEAATAQARTAVTRAELSVEHARGDVEREKKLVTSGSDEQRLRSRGDGDAAHDAERQHRVDDPPPPAPAVPAARTRLGPG
jgi:hypothetical protein